MVQKVIEYLNGRFGYRAFEIPIAKEIVNARKTASFKTISGFLDMFDSYEEVVSSAFNWRLAKCGLAFLERVHRYEMQLRKEEANV